MLKKSLKYIIVATANLTILTALLAFWTDELEMTFNTFVRPFEFLKILGFSILSLMGMRILVYYFIKKSIVSTSTKIKSAALLTFLISSYLYVDYSSKFINNFIVNGELRKRITDKIEPANGLANGTKATNLTIQEYQQIAETAGFQKLPLQATNIEYSYAYDGFLPDYLFTLTYDLPNEMKVDKENYSNGDFSKSRTFEILDNNKRVTYSEEVH